MNLDKINYGENPDNINVVIEISAGSNVKYKIEKENGSLLVERMLHSSIHYPANYGFVNKTLCVDGDCADVLVMTEYPLIPGSIVKCRLIGALLMEDESAMDEKLIALPISEIDPSFDEIQDITDVSKHTLAKIKNFFETYKMLEPNKWVKVKNYENKEVATQILEDAISNYNK